MTSQSLWLVQIEFKRVQTFLFAVPRLPVMVGANALMGETLRGVWTGEEFAAAVESSGGGVLDVRSLPRIAQDCEACLPDGLEFAFSSGVDRGSDPLYSEGAYQDDVAEVARRAGVLSRDGGHFEAIFADKPGKPPATERAKSFIQQARALLHERLPGAAADIRLREVRRQGEAYVLDETGSSRSGALRGTSLLSLTQARVCEDSGNEPASEDLEEGGAQPREIRAVSSSVAARAGKGQAFDSGHTRDVLGILRPRLLSDLQFDVQAHRAFPADFNQLSKSGYMAVIHLDGNSVGRRYLAYRDAAGTEDFFERWKRREQFFHTARAGVRAATVQAIHGVFADERTRNGKVPLRLLMLGGDDLVVVCEAYLAMPFLIALAQGITAHTEKMPDAEPGTIRPLSVGAGVAIVQSSFPFHRAYELADQLASSAKRLKARLGEGASAQEGNVVDWIISTEAWHGDIEQTRQRDALVDNLILSSKPYRILEVASEDEGKAGRRPSLQRMWRDAEELVTATKEDRIGRGQLQGLARSLPNGRHTATFAAAVLPAGLRLLLSSKGYLHKGDGPQQNNADSPWEAAGSSGQFATRLLDLLELYELRMLKVSVSQGSRRAPSGRRTRSPSVPSETKG